MDYRYGSHTVYKIEYHFVWVTLRDGGRSDRGYDQTVFGTSFRAGPRQRFQGGTLDATFSRRVSGLSDRYSNPPALAGGCLEAVWQKTISKFRVNSENN